MKLGNYLQTFHAVVSAFGVVVPFASSQDLYFYAGQSKLECEGLDHISNDYGRRDLVSHRKRWKIRWTMHGILTNVTVKKSIK